MTTRWVEERFGPPAFISKCRPAADRQAVTELIYRTRHAWVQVLTDEESAVVRFSITVTDSKFKFKAHELTLNHLRVKLGHSRFVDIQASIAEPEGYSLQVGAHNFEYSEAFYFGNPGNYQHFVLSHNDSAIGRFDVSAGGGPQWCEIGVLEFGDPPRPDHPVFDPKAVYATQFRANTTINTLTILGPGRDLSDPAEPRGADSDQVRGLVADAHKRRHRRRLIRKWNKCMLRDVTRRADDNQASQLPTSTIE